MAKQNNEEGLTEEELIALLRDSMAKNPPPIGGEAPEPAAAHSPIHLGLQIETETILVLLSPTDRSVLELLFGLEDGNARSHAEVAKLFNITEQEVEDCERRVLEGLRRKQDDVDELGLEW